MLCQYMTTCCRYITVISNTNPPPATHMMHAQSIVVLFLLPLVALLSACGSLTEQSHPSSISHISGPHVELDNPRLVEQTLHYQYNLWRGTPYRLGGLDRNGVDCSGFVYLIFRTRFGLLIPRTTDEQIAAGSKIAGRRLAPGDLVFFSTGLFDRHVGIYMGDNFFLHASKNRGVMVSNLADDYWRSNFEEARRIR